MKALILVGGYGTRLRPLTLSVPKPLIDFCNKSIVEHQIAALVKAGVTHVILAVAYQPSAMTHALQTLEDKFGIRITCSREEEPLGTAGPIALARDYLLDSEDDNDSFFVCNSDVICQFPYADMLKAHNSSGAEATILVTKVRDPSAYGVVVHDEASCKVSEFVEKPKTFVGDCINAGLYVLRKTVIDRIEPRPSSIEKEVFPRIAQDGGLFCVKLNGYWADIGKPQDFLEGMTLYLQAIQSARKSTANNNSQDTTLPTLSSGNDIIGNVLIDPSAKIGKGCVIGPNVTIGAHCVVGEGCRIANSALMSGVVIKDYSWLSEAIVGWQSTVGKWVRIEGLTVVGEDVQIHNECYINAAFVLPHKAITNSIHTAGTIIM